MKKSLLCFLAALLAGCAQFHSNITEQEFSDGSLERTTIVSASTLFDSKSELAKLSSGQTGKSQKVSIGTLNQASEATNAVALVETVIGAAVRAAVKP
jgi:hypothetical protein